MMLQEDINHQWKTFFNESVIGQNSLKILINFGDNPYLLDLNILEMEWMEESDESLNAFFYWKIECKGVKGKVVFFVNYAEMKTGINNFELNPKWKSQI